MKLFVTLISLLLFSTMSYAGEKITFTEAETLSVPVAVQMDIKGIYINFDSQSIDVSYIWLDADGNGIETDGCLIQAFHCDQNCFRNAFEYKIKNNDQGYSIGLFFRDLVWDEMKGKKLKAGNDGQFDNKKNK